MRNGMLASVLFAVDSLTRGEIYGVILEMFMREKVSSVIYAIDAILRRKSWNVTEQQLIIRKRISSVKYAILTLVVRVI
jgi:hypothetical protein